MDLRVPSLLRKSSIARARKYYITEEGKQIGEISRTLRVQRRLPGFVLRDFLDRMLLATLAVRSSSFWNLYVTFGGDRTGLVSGNFTLERGRKRQKNARNKEREVTPRRERGIGLVATQTRESRF